MFNWFKSKRIIEKANKIYRTANVYGLQLAIGYKLYKTLRDDDINCDQYFDLCVNSTEKAKKSAEMYPRKTVLLYRAFKKHVKIIEMRAALDEPLNEVPV